MLEELQTLLEMEGFSVITRQSGEAGLHCLEEYPAKLVIADQKMPGMSGTAFLAQVKAHYPDCVTMILSAYAEPHYLMDAVNEVGVYRYLQKPWKQDELLGCVAEALRLYQRQAEARRQAKQRLWDNAVFLGKFAGALHERLFPFLEAHYLMTKEDSAPGSPTALPSVLYFNRQDIAYAGVVVGKLGQLAARFQSFPDFRRLQAALLVRRCVGRARDAAREQGISVVWDEDYEPGLPDLWIDEAEFTLALKAVLENAVQFNPIPAQPEAVYPANSPSALFAWFRQRSAGEAAMAETVERRRVQVCVYTTDQPEPALCIDVRDNGMGLDDPEQPFDPLYSTCLHTRSPDVDVHSEYRYNFSPAGHAGLGLTLARWSITRHDGTLELVNPGEPGACFRIEIPLAQAELKRRVRAMLPDRVM